MEKSPCDVVTAASPHGFGSLHYIILCSPSKEINIKEVLGLKKTKKKKEKEQESSATVDHCYKKVFTDPQELCYSDRLLCPQCKEQEISIQGSSLLPKNLVHI